jgi:hypothetical protein
VDIALPSQSLILAGESLEVDNLVTRATPIDGEGGAVSRRGAPAQRSISRELSVPETQVRQATSSSAAPRLTGSIRGRSPLDLYRYVGNMNQQVVAAPTLDVFA